MPDRSSRRHLLRLGALTAALSAAACADDAGAGARRRSARRQEDGGGGGAVSSRAAASARGRLGFRPSRPQEGGGRPGRQQVRAGGGAKAAEVYVPAGDRPSRLVLCLHGAGSGAAPALDRLLPWADEHRLLLVAPKSAAASWDVIAGGFGPDVRAIDALLTELSARHPVSSYAVTGFSDGASYALTLGLVNGDLFDAVVAWSPGFEAAPSRTGRPRFFVSHGTDDQVLPISATSRRLVPALQDDGYDVTYIEYPGGHVATEAVRQQAVEWLVGGPDGR